MRTRLLVAAMLAAVADGAAADAGGAVGVATIAATTPDAARELTLTVWYPAAPGGQPVLVGDNAVFEGVAGARDAPIAEGRFPVVLIAHGGLRSAADLGGWIAARLAADEFLAVQVQAPRLEPGDAARAVEEIARRPGDLSAALAALAEAPGWSDHIDMDRVAALGFFLGGTSALALAGARMDADKFAGTCDSGGHGLDCAWLEAAGIDLRQVDVQSVARSSRDPRVRAVLAIDPEYSGSLSGESLAAIEVPVAVINLGAPGAIPPGLDASALRSAAPTIAYTSVPAATRFAAFSLCKPKGAAILAEDGGDAAICGDDRDSRAELHALLAGLISDFLREHLQTSE